MNPVAGGAPWPAVRDRLWPVRTLGAWLLLLSAGVGLVGLALGAGDARAELAAASTGLPEAWGTAVGGSVARVAARWTHRFGLDGTAAGPFLPWLGPALVRHAPRAWQLLGTASLFPPRIAIHAYALGYWLGLLAPLAWILDRSVATASGPASGSVESRADAGGWPRATLACAVLLWSATSLASLGLAPAWAAALLVLRLRTTHCGADFQP